MKVQHVGGSEALDNKTIRHVSFFEYLYFYLEFHGMLHDNIMKTKTCRNNWF
jgi:hypothetical protein